MACACQTVKNKIADPDYIFLRIKSEVNYDPDLSSISSKSLQSAVSTIIRNYIDSNLDKFDKGLRFSKLLRQIDDVDDSILSNETSIILEKRYSPTSEVNQSFTMDFSNPIFHPHDGHTPVVVSTKFRYVNQSGTPREGYIEDDGNGYIRLIATVGGDKVVDKSNVGNVNYSTGLINVSGINITSSIDYPEIRVRVEPGSQDISSNKRVILTLDYTDSGSLSVTAIQQGYGYTSIGGS